MNEPVRKTYLDIVKRNLRAADRLTFCTRLIYYGEYRDTAENFQKQIRSIINSLNAEYNEIPIFGLLLVYQKHFIHLVTAPEEMIFRHLKAMFNAKEGEIQLGKVFNLPVHHHVYRPYFTSWYSVITKPPILLEKLENTELPEIEKYVKNVMIKIYKLCEFLMDTNLKSGDSVPQILKDIEEKVPEYLPENAVLEFLLNSNCPVVSDLREHLGHFLEIPYINFHSERVWPVPCNFMPHNIFFELKPSKQKENNEENVNSKEKFTL